MYKGLKIESSTPTKKLIQYVITQSKDQIFKSEEKKIYFEGTFAVITTDDKENLQNIYIGEGEKLIFKNEEFIPENRNKAMFIDYTDKD